MDVHVNSNVFSEDEALEIKQIVKEICKEMWIDKSYVEFSENKHEDVFMLEKGWNELCKLVL